MKVYHLKMNLKTTYYEEIVTKFFLPKEFLKLSLFILFEICRCFDLIIIGLTASATGLRSIARRRRLPAAKAVATASLDLIKSGDWRGISGAASTSQG